MPSGDALPNFREDSENKNYVLCTLCGGSVFRGTSGSLASMNKHNLFKHKIPSGGAGFPPSLLSMVELPLSLSSPSVCPASASALVRSESEASNESKFLHNLVLLCARECLPLDFVRSDTFAGVCTQFSVVLPTSECIQNEFDRVEQDVIENIRREIEEVSLLSLSVELFAVQNDQTVLQLSAHWIAKDLSYRHAVLGAKYYFLASDVPLLLSKILSRFPSLLSKVVGVITERYESLLPPLQSMFAQECASTPTIIPCFSSLLDECFSTVLFDRSYSYPELSTVKSVMQYYHSCHLFRQTWESKNPTVRLNYQKSMGWARILESVQHLLQHWALFIEFMRPYLPPHLYQDCVQHSKLDQLRWFFSLFSPLLEVIPYMRTEGYCSIGSLYPYLRAFAQYVSSPDRDWSSAFAKDLGGCLRLFSEYYSRLDDVFLGCSSALDPRYKDMLIFDESERQQIRGALVQSMYSRSSQSLAVSSTSPVLSSSLPLSASSSPSGSIFESLQKRRKLSHQSDPPTSQPQSLVNDYLSHDVEHEDGMDMYGWWLTHQTKYSLLIPSVKKYSCLPSTACEKEMTFSEAPLPFYSKRRNLDESFLESSLLLRGNNDFLKHESRLPPPFL